MNYNLEELSVLTFNMNGVMMAVDASQVDRMMDVDEAVNRQINVKWLDDKIHFYGKKIVFTAPKVLLIKDEKIPFGIVVDEPGDILSVSIDSIRPLPPLISASEDSGTIWGAALIDEDVVLLVDFYKMPAEPPHSHKSAG